MPPEKQYERSDVLESATLAFWSRGYESTSINDLVDVTGLNRGSLYAAFDGKRGLFLECLSHYDRRYREDFLNAVSRGRAPRERIIAAFELAARPPEETGLPPGCLLVNSALEVSPHDPEIRNLVNDCLAEVRAFFQSNLAAAQATGSVPDGRDPVEMSEALLGLFLGLRVMVRTGLNETAVSAVINQARALLTGND